MPIPTTDDRADWLYLKIFWKAFSADPSEILLDLLRPCAFALREAGLIKRFFYLLYVEEDFHVRFRLAGEPDALANQVRPFLESALLRFRDRAPAETPRFVNDPLEKRNSPLFTYATYEPETEKYGGPEGLRLSEEHFQHSSEAAFSILQTVREKAATRSQAAILATEVLVRSFGFQRDQRVEFYGRCRDYWVSRMPVDQAEATREYFRARSEKSRPVLLRQLGLLESGTIGPLRSVMDAWGAAARRTFTRLQDLSEKKTLTVPTSFVLQNYVHVFMNRLGIPLVEEAYLLHLLREAPIDT